MKWYNIIAKLVDLQILGSWSVERAHIWLMWPWDANIRPYGTLLWTPCYVFGSWAPQWTHLLPSGKTPRPSREVAQDYSEGCTCSPNTLKQLLQAGPWMKTRRRRHWSTICFRNQGCRQRAKSWMPTPTVHIAGRYRPQITPKPFIHPYILLGWKATASRYICGPCTCSFSDMVT